MTPYQRYPGPYAPFMVNVVILTATMKIRLKRCVNINNNSISIYLKQSFPINLGSWGFRQLGL